MFTYIPSLTLVLVSLFAVGVLYVVRVPLIAITLIAIVLLVITINQHFALFSFDYAQTSWTQALASYAPFILVGAVIFMALGYIFMLSAPGAAAAAVNAVTAPNGTITPAAMSNTYAALNKYANKGYNAVRNNLGFNNSKGRNEFLSALNRAI